MSAEHANTDPVELSQASRDRIDHWLTKYPPDQRQSALIPALTIIQEENAGAHQTGAQGQSQRERSVGLGQQ